MTNTPLSPMFSAFVLALTAAGCGGSEGRQSRQLTLAFQAQVGAQPASCSVEFSELGSSKSAARLADARLFVSELELRSPSGEWVPVELDESDWQSQGVALLDFEDATGACADSGTRETNTTLTGRVDEGDYEALRFKLGIPFELNHVDSATAPAPFNVPGMFWTWQGGYKFLRVDWLVAARAVPRWNVHLGATGCVSDGPTDAPEQPCSRPNRASIELDSFDPDLDPVVALDLGALVAGADLSANITDTPPGCMSGPGEPQDCAPVFSALGLSFDDGSCVEGCAAQAPYRWEMGVSG